MKKILFLLLVPLSAFGQIKEQVYPKLPWQNCFQFYENFFDHYKNAKISPSILNYTDVGVLECYPSFKVFLKRKDGMRQEIALPDSLQKINIFCTGLFFNSRDSTIGIWYEDFDKVFGTILFSINKNEWRIYSRQPKVFANWHDCDDFIFKPKKKEE